MNAPHPTPQARIDAILAAAVDLYGIPLSTLRAPGQVRPIALARQEIFTALLLSGQTPAQVARLFCRDHSTVTHGRDRVLHDPERLRRAEALAESGRRLNLWCYLDRQLLAPAPERAAIEAYLRVCVLGERRYWPCLCALGLMLLSDHADYRTAVDRCLVACGMGQYSSLIDLQARRLAS